MLDVTNIHALSSFTRNARKHVKRLRDSGEPELLTINGKAAVVIQDAQAYQQLVADADLAESVVKIRKALDRLDAGEQGIDARSAVEQLALETGMRLRGRKKRK